MAVDVDAVVDEGQSRLEICRVRSRIWSTFWVTTLGEKYIANGRSLYFS